jgi:4-amino-4-deoxy-L-arabinose transferase-like glycosyltransferase
MKACSDPKSLMIPKSVARTLRKLALPVSMLALFALATYVRLHFVIVRGGLEQVQIDWAFGGLTNVYLKMRDVILAGQTEPSMWPYMPGYPAFLAILDLIGLKDLRSVRIVQCVLDAAAICPLAYVVAHLTRSRFLAVFAAGIYALSPWWAQGAGYLLSESLEPALVISVLAGMVWARNHPQSLRGWATLGFLSSILPFFRSEMILLVAPLVFWAVMVGLPKRRVFSAVIVALAFTAPIMTWCLRNYLIHGHFALVPPAGWYNMWSGLGQVANDFGYVVDDARAIKLLQSKGIVQLTPASETFWKNEYFRAWSEHPGHVLRAIQFRMNFILTSCDYKGSPLLGMCVLVYSWFAWATLLAIIWLLWKQRWPEAFLIGGPMAFALLSLGFVYVEARYVRYAALSYVLGFPVLLALVVDFVTSRFRPLKPLGGRALIKAALAAAGVAAISIYFATQQPMLNRAEYQSMATANMDSSDWQFLQHPGIVAQPLTFEPVIPAASTTIGPQVLDVQAAVRNSSYLIMAPLNASKAAAAVISYRIKLIEGDLTMAILSGNQQIYLSHRSVYGLSDSVQEGSFQSPVEASSQIVISAWNPTERGSKFQIQDLKVSFLCVDDPPGFVPLYLFGGRWPRSKLCNQQALRP